MCNHLSRNFVYVSERDSTMGLTRTEGVEHDGKNASVQRAVWRNGGGKCRFER
jgi:hypothetical protein